jgi:zinc-binding alcohol dehydrogenase family protein
MRATMMTAFVLPREGGVDLLEERDVPRPALRPRDILVRIQAVAMNPVDTQVRDTRGKFKPKDADAEEFPEGKILGYDGAGVVEQLGVDASMFQAGERVYFAGDITRNGTNADFVAIDERIVAKMPTSLSFAEAAAVPLTMLTAWEGLFESMRIPIDGPRANVPKRLLVLPGAGGVGTWAIQLAKELGGLFVIATASRSESATKAKELGADLVINHRDPLLPQLKAAGIEGVDYIYDGYGLHAYAVQYAEILKAFGQILTIVPSFAEAMPSISVPMAFKRASIHYEILARASRLIDKGALKVSIQDILPWSLESLQEAHRLQQSGQSIGKIIMAREEAA